MVSDNTSLSQAAEIVDLAAISVSLLKKLRDEITDDEWEQVIENSKVDELITSLFDLEDAIDNAG